MYDKEFLRNIIRKLPKNEKIAKDVLSYFSNNTTKVVIDDDIKGNYYVFLNDTIYISNNPKNKNASDFTRLTVTCHECIHSIQSKLEHLINYVFSNIELITFIVFFILKLFNVFNNQINIVYPIICVISILPRLHLENDAISRSFNLTKVFLEKYNVKNNEVSYFTQYLNSKKCFMLISNIFYLSFGKILRMFIILAI